MKCKEPPPDMVVPAEIEVRQSSVDSDKLGLWCKKTIKKGSRFGPFVGEKALEVDDRMDPTFIWEIVDIETKEFLFYINATDPRRGNWMRYINCARYFEEQNIVSEQDGIDIFYEAIKDIEPGEELLTWYEKMPLRKRKGKRRPLYHVRRAKTAGSTLADPPAAHPPPQSSSSAPANPNTGTSSVSLRGRRRSAKRYWTIEETADPRDAAEAAGEESSENEEIPAEIPKPRSRKSAASSPTNSVKDAEIGPSTLGDSGRFFQFELLPIHSGKSRLGRRMFQCDICSGVYRHGFSLKRHYIRNHINRRYVSRIDALNCNVSFGADDDVEKSQQQSLENPSPEKPAATDDAAAAGKSVPEIQTSPGSLNSGKAASDDGATLQMDVDEIDSGKEPTPSPPEKTREASTRRGEPAMPGLFRCYICECVYDTSSQLKSHFSEKHMTGTDKRFACRHCQMQFKHRQNLLRHEVVHSGAKPYVCDKCDKRFPTLTNQRRHERIHCGTRLACSLCSSSFTQTGDLKKHVRRQHPESYRPCSYCSRYFTADSQLSVHLRRAHPGTDLSANRLDSARRSAALEADRAESRRLANGAADGSASAAAPSSAEQFACTVCSKGFSDYPNMCRHRRLAHGCGVGGADLDLSSSEAENDSVAVTTRNGHANSIDAQQAYFATVAKNIETNLRYHLEGNADHLSRAGLHVRWRQRPTPSSLMDADRNHAEVKLEEFNFPHGFEIRSLAELYSMTPPSTPSNSGTDLCIKLECETPVSNVATPDSTPPPKDPSLINIPDVRMCGICKAVFHGSSALNDHVSSAHSSSPSKNFHKLTPELTLDQPLDLSPTLTKPEKLMENGGLLAIARPEKTPAGVGSRKFVCLVCFREFADNDLLLCHQAERHPNIDCRHIEVDVDFSPKDIVKRPSAVGLLNVSSCLLPSETESESEASGGSEVTCTKCKGHFPSRTALHAHIVDCGDYWKSLPDRLTWVFVLRGSQLPAPTSGPISRKQQQQQRRRGKFRWGTISTKESMRRQLQQMLVQQHVGIAGTTSMAAPSAAVESSRRSGRISSSHRGSVSPPRGDAVTGKPRKPAAPLPPPRRHARRRQGATAAAVEPVQCGSCSASFVTQTDLDTHLVECRDTKTENVSGNSDAPVAELQSDAAAAALPAESDDDDFDPTKHLCIYCSRQFTFLRALRRHIDFCAVRRDLVEKNEYIDADWEQQLQSAVATAAGSGGARGGGSMDGDDTADAESARKGGGSGGKRKRRCRNWSSNKSKSRGRTGPSGEEADDSLFGWEDAYLSTWGKDERADITVGRKAVVAEKAQEKEQKVIEAREETDGDKQGDELEVMQTVGGKDEASVEESQGLVVSKEDLEADSLSCEPVASGDVEKSTVVSEDKELQCAAETPATSDLLLSSAALSSSPAQPETTASTDLEKSSGQSAVSVCDGEDIPAEKQSPNVSVVIDAATEVSSSPVEPGEEEEEEVEDEVNTSGVRKTRKRRAKRLTIVKRKRN